MNVLSVCSGVGGMDRGLEAAGMTVVGLCEFDPHARSVLERHWPDVPCHPDLTTLNGKEWHGRVDLVAGGTPCTDLSVAGRRAGLGGEHSRLFWDFCRVAADSAARWVLWENVAGALSSNDGEDFAAVLWGLTGFRPSVPENGWRTIGMCVGPDRTAVWRLLDARWFGVAQRRRRVFVVAGAREQCSLSVLVEPESVPRGARPGSAAGSVVAALTANGVGAGGGVDDNAAQAGHVVPALTSRCGNTQDDQQTGQLAVAVSENQRGEVLLTPYARQLAAGAGKPGQGYPAVLSFAWQAGVGSVVDTDDTCHTLVTSQSPAVMRWVGGVQQDEFITPDGYVGALAHSSAHHSGHHEPKVLTPDLAVRRLTPRECERLMSWPDDWTRYAADGTEIADSHRYRMCGNGVVSNCTEWIGKRIMEASET